MTRYIIDKIIALAGSSSLREEWSKSGWMDFIWESFDLAIAMILIVLAVSAIRLAKK